MNSSGLGTGSPSVVANLDIPLTVDTETTPVERSAKPAAIEALEKPFYWSTNVDSLDYPTKLAMDLAEQHRGHVWIVVVSADGRVKHSGKAVKLASQEVELRDEALQSISMEAYASANPIISGFPIEKLNTASLVLDQARRRSSLGTIFAFSSKFDAVDGGVVIIVGWEAQADVCYATINAMMEKWKLLTRSVEQSELCRFGFRLLGWQRQCSTWSPVKQRWLAVCALAVFALLWIPVPFYPKRECEIQPASRTYVSSPIDGFLERAYVRPGDQVEANALLARLDEQNIRRELSSARAEYEAAQKRQDRALSIKSGGDLRIAQLEQDQISLKIQTLESNLEKLEARSLAAGVVVQGDWQGSEGQSVTMGQTLFEIAPLDSMMIEVHLKPEDLAWCTVGTKVTVHSEASAGKSWSGRVERIDPAAEIENDTAFFVAELKVENADGALRPGMKGLVRLHGGRRSLAWMLFHSPYQWFVHQWVW